MNHDSNISRLPRSGERNCDKDVLIANEVCNQEQLSALLDGELDEEARADVLAHLDECEACRAYLAELTALHTALGEPDGIDAPEGFADGVLARLRAERETKKRAPWRVWGAIAACAAVVILAVTALPRTGMMGGAAPKAASADTASPTYGTTVTADSGSTEAERTEGTLYLTRNAAEAPATGTAGGTAYAVEDADEPPTLTLEGEGAAEWLAANAEPLGGNRWRVTVEAANALPETLALVGAQEPSDGALVVTLGTAEGAQ